MRVLSQNRPTVQMAHMEESGQYGGLTEPVEIKRPPTCFQEGMFWVHCWKGQLQITHPTGLITLGAGYQCRLAFDGQMYSDEPGTCASIVRWSWLHSGAIFSPPTIEVVEYKTPPNQLSPRFKCQRGMSSDYEHHGARCGHEFVVGFERMEVNILVFQGQIISVHNHDLDVRSNGDIPGRLFLESGETERFRVVSDTADLIVMTTTDLNTTRGIYAFLGKPCPY